MAFVIKGGSHSVTVLRVAGFVKLKFTMTRLTDSVNLTTDDLMTLRLMTVYDL